jgi:error-prone DNA polymerase
VWQVEEAVRPVGPLLKAAHSVSSFSPLQQMNIEERLSADYSGTGLTVGKHPLHYCRKELQARKVLSAEELRNYQHGQFVRAAGCVIARQRPGTAKGFIFISMEDETGIANVIVTPDLYERERLVVTRSKFILVEGALQNQDGVIHVKAKRIRPLEFGNLDVRSHDFH